MKYGLLLKIMENKRNHPQIILGPSSYKNNFQKTEVSLPKC